MSSVLGRLTLLRGSLVVDPMVLSRTKAAINRSYEIMDMKSALRSALDADILLEGEGSALKRDFLAIVRERGLGKALAWRQQKFATRDE